MGHAGAQSLAARRPAVAARHIGRRPGFVDKDEPVRIEIRSTRHGPIIGQLEAPVPGGGPQLLALSASYLAEDDRTPEVLAAISGVYYWRAKTEEWHLGQDPVYRAYSDWMLRQGWVTKRFHSSPERGGAA